MALTDSISSLPSIRATVQSDSANASSPATDSLTADSTAVQLNWGVVLTPPPSPAPQPEISDSGLSWSILLLLAPCVILAVKMRTSPGFIRSLFKDLWAVRERTSIFDTTVRESTLMFFLCLETVISGGILLASAVAPSAPPPPGWLSFMPPLLAQRVICISVMGGYMLFMWIAYHLVGRVFESAQHTRLWVRGFAASMALAGLIWTPCALLALAKPEWSATMAIIAAIAFILAKIAFVWKGFRIFFSKAASWILFLYYLCSLEAVPVILTLAAALKWC